MDRKRANPQYLNDIFETLDFMGILWDEGPRNVYEFEQSYSQLKRTDIYNNALNLLNERQLVFACTCSRSQLNSGSYNIICNCKKLLLPLDTPGACWRLITDKDSLITIRQLNEECQQFLLPAGMQNFIVRKKDGFPSYQLTSLMDDLFHEVDLITRGQDLWPSTIAQHYLADALKLTDFNLITFHHHSLIVDEAGKKLSKSAGATSINYLRATGKTKADIYTMIADLTGIKSI